MEKKHNFWFGFAMLLLGVIIGFFMAPMKKGVSVKNICGNQNWIPEEEDEDCCCEACEDEEYSDEDDMPF